MNASIRFRRRQVGFWLAVTLGTICLMAGALLTTLSRSFLDASAFAESTSACLSDEGVSAFVADHVTGAILRRNHDLVAVRPLILAASKAVVTSEPFRNLVRRAAHRAHQMALSETSRQVALSLPDVDVLLRGAIRHASPELAGRIPKKVDALLASITGGVRGRQAVRLWRLFARVRWEGPVLLAAGWLLLAAGVWIAPARRRGLVQTGFAMILCGLTSAALLPIGSLVVATYFEDPLLEGAVDGMWRTYMAGLRTWGVFFGGLGVLLAAGSASLLEAVNPVSQLRRLGTLLVTPPPARPGRILWGTLIAGAGLALTVYPAQVLTGAVVLAGVCGAYVGTRELFRLALETVAASPEEQAATGQRRLARRVALVTVICAVSIAGWVAVRHPSVAPIQPALTACNGHAKLCELRVDRAVFAGAHNAMSHEKIADWMFPHHQDGIPQQLRDGVRALLFDVHYGFPGGSRVKTDLAGLSRRKLEEAVGADGVAAAQRIRDRLTGVGAERHELYLCHGFCELGAYQLEPVLGQIREFLIERPSEVLILIIEDYTSPGDLAAAFERSGLRDLVYSGPSAPWPTLGELVSSGQRVIVFLESGKQGVPWLRPAFEHIQETPYTFHDPKELSCRPNRGGTDGSLFLVNHWIDTAPAPRPSNAEMVNRYDFLLARAKQCSAERGKMVNVLAVDFFRTGDLLRVVDTLNGVTRVPEAATE